MAKKTKSYSQVQATDKLEQLGKRGTSASEFIHDLLRIFAGYGDGQIRRTKDGPGNLAKDGETVLIKDLENRCREKRLKYHQTQDEVCEKKEVPLAKVKAMLAQKIEQSKLVNFYWRSV